MMIATLLRHVPGCVAATALLAVTTPAYGAPDLGKKACAQEAKRLCPAEMKSFSRKKVEACMISRINQTSTVCHEAMLRIKGEREIAETR